MIRNGWFSLHSVEIEIEPIVVPKNETVAAPESAVPMQEIDPTNLGDQYKQRVPGEEIDCTARGDADPGTMTKPNANNTETKTNRIIESETKCITAAKTKLAFETETETQVSEDCEDINMEAEGILYIRNPSPAESIQYLW